MNSSIRFQYFWSSRITSQYMQTGMVPTAAVRSTAYPLACLADIPIMERRNDNEFYQVCQFVQHPVNEMNPNCPDELIRGGMNSMEDGGLAALANPQDCGSQTYHVSVHCRQS